MRLARGRSGRWLARVRHGATHVFTRAATRGAKLSSPTCHRQTRATVRRACLAFGTAAAHRGSEPRALAEARQVASLYDKLPMRLTTVGVGARNKASNDFRVERVSTHELIALESSPESCRSSSRLRLARGRSGRCRSSPQGRSPRGARAGAVRTSC